MTQARNLRSPEWVAKELQSLRAEARELEKLYKKLYVAAKNGSSSGGSLGQMRSGVGKSDPTADAALSPAEAELRRGAKYIEMKVRDAGSDLGAAKKRIDSLLESKPPFEMEPKRPRWRVHVWSDLPCGCARDDQGWYVVTRECSAHMRLIPLADRVPFSEIVDNARHRFGPFQPAATGPAS